MNMIKNIFLKVRSIVGILMRKYHYYRYYDKRHISTIKSFHNIHKGEKCYIIGSGPSIKKTNMKLLKNEITIGLNKLYRGNIGFVPTYWVLVSRNLHTSVEVIKRLGSKLFVMGKCGRIHSKYSYYMKYPIVVKELGEISVWKKISKNLVDGAMSGKMVAFETLQLAYYMGFTEVYLIGMDYTDFGSYFFKGANSDDKYFNNPKFKNINGKKKITDRPTKLNEIFSNYSICKRAYEKDNRKIYNATVGGKLEVFERKSLEESLSESTFKGDM